MKKPRILTFGIIAMMTDDEFKAHAESEPKNLALCGLLALVVVGGLVWLF